jgi:hypothetical protein
VTDEHVVFDRDAFADERMTRDLAAPPDDRVPLNLDKRPDSRIVPDRAAVKIDESGKADVVAQPDVRGNALKLAFECQQAPLPAFTAPSVSKRILKSVVNDEVLTYRRSRRTISSKLV